MVLFPTKLIFKTDLETPVIVGVASEFIDPDAFSIPIPGYGSVDVYTGLNKPSTLRFLAEEGLYTPTPNVAAVSQAVSNQTTTYNFSLNDSLGARVGSELTEVNNLDLVQGNIFNPQQDDLNLVSTVEI